MGSPFPPPVVDRPYPTGLIEGVCGAHSADVLPVPEPPFDVPPLERPPEPRVVPPDATPGPPLDWPPKPPAPPLAPFRSPPDGRVPPEDDTPPAPGLFPPVSSSAWSSPPDPDAAPGGPSLHAAARRIRAHAPHIEMCFTQRSCPGLCNRSRCRVLTNGFLLLSAMLWSSTMSQSWTKQ